MQVFELQDLLDQLREQLMVAQTEGMEMRQSNEKMLLDADQTRVRFENELLVKQNQLDKVQAELVKTYGEYEKIQTKCSVLTNLEFKYDALVIHVQSM